MKSLIYILSVCIVFIGCGNRPKEYTLTPNSVSSGNKVSYLDLEHWKDDDLSDAFSVFKEQCIRGGTPGFLAKFCKKASQTKGARVFFEDNFVPIALYNSKSKSYAGLMTGYYEPMLHGSLVKDKHYRYPLYGIPDDLVTVKLDTLYPELRGKKLRGRLSGGRLVPMPSRAQIDSGEINASAICYVDNEIDRFFLQVQGSGRIKFKDGKTIFVGYADENGHPYHSIGRRMIDKGYIQEKDISLQSIRAWLDGHPDKSRGILESNPSFIFFEKREHGATGSLGIELTPMRSLAVDRSFIPLGMPLFYEAVDPLTGEPLCHLGFAQDTGGAIKGQVRADLFFGFGKEAEAMAGKMKSPLRLWMLMPKEMTAGD